MDIEVDVWLYGPLAQYGLSQTGSPQTGSPQTGSSSKGASHAHIRMQFPSGSCMRDLLKRLSLPTDERGITFIDGKLSAMPGVQPDFDYELQNNNRIAFFHLRSMWPFQYRHGATVTPALSNSMAEQGRTS